MYATVVQCDMHTIDSSHERGQVGRILATRLSEIAGFVAFVALDIDAVAGSVAALCIFEDRAGITAADDAIEQWQREYPVVGTGIQRHGAGAVIAQKGL
jgi:hypothetical protein